MIFVQRPLQWCLICSCLSSWGFCGLWCHTIIFSLDSSQRHPSDHTEAFVTELTISMPAMLSGDSVSLKLFMDVQNTSHLFQQSHFSLRISIFSALKTRNCGTFPLKIDFWIDSLCFVSDRWWLLGIGESHKSTAFGGLWISIHGWIHGEHVVQKKSEICKIWNAETIMFWSHETCNLSRFRSYSTLKS